MKNLLKKLFYWDAPAHGALFSTILFLPGSWILLAGAVLSGGISPEYPGIFHHNGAFVWQIFCIAEIFLFAYLLICGTHFGKRYYKELSFSKRKKWQIPATICWILLAFPVLQAFNVFFILTRTMEQTSLFSQIMTGKLMIGLSCTGFLAMFAGIFCTAKIIETATQIPWYKLFGKCSSAILILFLIIISAAWLKLA